jgi:hypothetical protein
MRQRRIDAALAASLENFMRFYHTIGRAIAQTSGF